MKYVELCAGMGGTRAGLDAAGWRCALALDHNQDAVLVHTLVHGAAIKKDVTSLLPEEVPHADVWVAGFPCQPFSSSGGRLGGEHKSGHVFEHLSRLIRERHPPVVVLENVEGLLTNKSGHTFATILATLTSLRYDVDWIVVDLRWHEVPQSRPRLFVLAAKKGTLRVGALPEATEMLPGIGATVPSVLCDYLGRRKLRWSLRSRGRIGDVVERMRPAIGKAHPSGPQLFAGLGHASGDDYYSFDLSGPLVRPAPGSLAAVVAPDFPDPEKIRSARYWSSKGGGGPRGLHIRDEALSHCVGTSLGGAPLFAVPTGTVANAKRRRAFLRFANWHREQDGVLIMRLIPERAVLLFGPHTAGLSEALAKWDAGATRKYALVGNMVAPVCAEEIGRLIQQHMSHEALADSCEDDVVGTFSQG